MFRVSVFTFVVAGVLLLAADAQAGIFFRRGGCSGGQCGVVYTMPAASATTSTAATSESSAPQEEKVAQEAPKAEDAASGDQQAGSAASTQTAPVRRVGFRGLTSLRLFGRWR
jgi:hypothetical protein